MNLNNSQLDWWVLFALPNLKLRTSIDTDEIALAPVNDPRVLLARQASQDLDRLLSSFSDQFSNSIEPAVLIVNTNVTALRDAGGFFNLEALIDYRNLVAFCCTANGRAKAVNTDQYIGLLPYSDFFEFHPATVGSQSGYLHFRTALSMMGIDDSADFAGQCSMQVIYQPHLPPNLDTELYAKIVPIWRQLYIKKRGNWRIRAFFRSLQIAFQAAYSPFENSATFYNHGDKIVSWVSAFEILTHPGPNGRASARTVRNLLQKCTWKHPKLKARRYKIKYQRGARTITESAILPERLYAQLYDVRNSFAHGNFVRPNSLYAFKKPLRPMLSNIAPILFRQALYQTAEIIRPERVSSSDNNNENLWFGDVYVKALLRAAGQNP